jgi:hypothetical protein
MIRKNIRYLLIVLLLGTLSAHMSGCRQAAKSYAEMIALSNDVKRELKVEDVRVSYQNFMCIGVSIVNSRFNTAPEYEQEKARQIVLELIRKKYGNRKNITSAFVAFVEFHNWYIFRYTNGLNTRFYNKDQSGNWVDKDGKWYLDEHGKVDFDNLFSGKEKKGTK